MKRLLLILALLTVVLTGCSAKNDATGEYVVAIGEDADIKNKIQNIDVLVIDAEYFTAEDIELLKANNIKEIYSYLNIGSIENFRDYYEEFEAYSLGDYENWPEERWMDVSNKSWQKLVEKKASELSQKGIDGFFIDNVDVYYRYHSKEIYQGIVEILSVIHRTNKKIIINGGDVFVKEYVESENNSPLLFNGVNQESVYTKYDFSNNQYSISSSEELDYYTEYLDMLLQNGYLVYVLEYATDEKIANEASVFSSKNNYICYISDNIELCLNH